MNDEAKVAQDILAADTRLREHAPDCVDLESLHVEEDGGTYWLSFSSGCFQCDMSADELFIVERMAKVLMSALNEGR